MSASWWSGRVPRGGIYVFGAVRGRRLCVVIRFLWSRIFVCIIGPGGLFTFFVDGPGDFCTTG